MVQGMGYRVGGSWVSTAALPRMNGATLGRHSISLSLGCLNCTMDMTTFTCLKVVVRFKVLSITPGTQSVFNKCELLPFGSELGE